MPTAQRIAELIAGYADGPRQIEEAVAGLSRDELHFKPGPEHWDILENVVHVADTDLVAAGRIRFVIAQPGCTLVGMDQDIWARALNYTAQPLAEALALLRAVRAATVPVLHGASAAAWEQTGMHTEAGPMTMAWIVDHFVDHIQYHLRTIAKRRRQYAETRR